MNHPRTFVTAILLAGGLGSRMGSSVAKQFLELGNKPLILHSYDTFTNCFEIDEIVVVCAPEHHHLFAKHPTKGLTFAPPGSRRQDSVYNGLLKASPLAAYVCVHDGARPFVTEAMVTRTLEAAKSAGAATVGMPLRYTVKQVDRTGHVAATPDREMIWEIQTPQVIARGLLIEGFAHIRNKSLTVTDDVSAVELLGKPVKVVEGCHTNIKVTVPADFILAEQLLQNAHEKR